MTIVQCSVTTSGHTTSMLSGRAQTPSRSSAEPGARQSLAQLRSGCRVPPFGGDDGEDPPTAPRCVSGPPAAACRACRSSNRGPISRYVPSLDASSPAATMRDSATRVLRLR